MPWKQTWGKPIDQTDLEATTTTELDVDGLRSLMKLVDA